MEAGQSAQPFSVATALKFALGLALARLAVVGAQVLAGKPLDLWTDPDSNVRLQQVRDLLAGQDWFDLTLHRFGLIAGTDMHWSRLADIGPAGLLSLLALFLPKDMAEQALAILYPILLFIPLIVALMWAIKRLVPNQSNVAIGVALGFVIWQFPPLLGNFKPGIIDHQGQQIISLVVLIGAMTGQRTFASGIIAALGLVTGLVVGPDGVPVALMAFVALGVLWFLEPRAEAAFLKGLGIAVVCATPVAALIFMPRPWSNQWCDSWTPPLGAILFALGGLAFVLGAAATYFATDWRKRTVAIGLSLVCVALLLWANPACLRPLPLDHPWIWRYWMGNITENLPVWQLAQLDPVAPANHVAAPLALLMFGLISKGQAGAWRANAIVLVALLTAWVFAIWVMRGGPVMGALCAIVTAALLLQLRAKAVGPLQRVGALALCTPILPAFLLSLVLQIQPAQGASNRAFGSLGSPSSSAYMCLGAREVAQLRRLPQGLMVSPFGMTEYVLKATPHRVAFAGYHRAYRDNLAIMGWLMEAPKAARAHLVAAGVTYINLCPQTEQFALIAADHPDSFIAALVRGTPIEGVSPILALQDKGVTYQIGAAPAR